MRLFLLAYVVASVVLASCSRHEALPDKVMDADKMARVLADIHIAEASVNMKMMQGIDPKKTGSGYYRHIFAMYGIDQEVLDASMDYYALHPPLYEKVYDQVLEILSRSEAETEVKR